MSEKTCGNCGWFDNVIWVCHNDDGICGKQTVLKNDPACDEWKRRLPPLDKRYRQLEKVTKELYDFAWSTYWLKTSHELPEANGSILDRLADSELKSMRNKIAECGVIVDD